MLDLTRRAAAVAFIGQALTKNKAWASLPYAYDFTREGIMFLEWDELNPKKPLQTRLEEATAAYAARLGMPANLILVNEHDAGATFPGCEVRVETFVRVNCYQVGRQPAPCQP